MVKRIFLILTTPILLFSCNYVTPGLQVFWGNYHADQGNYSEANVSYLNALEGMSLFPIINYNLGNIYYRLGESDSALIRWEEIDSKERELSFRLLFNKGVYHYERGKYKEAASLFKQAVIISPSSHDAKINLELSLNRINTGYSLKSMDDKETKDNSLFDDTERLLNYLRRRETTQWESSNHESLRGGRDW